MRRPARPLHRALLVLVAAAATAATVGPATPSGADRAQTTGTSPRLVLLYQPATVGPTDAFTVLLGVEGADSATEIAVDIYDRVAPGEVVGPVPERDPLATFPVVPIAGNPDDPDAARTTGFTIALDDGTGTPDPSWGYRLEEAGVYPVRVRLRSAEGDTGVVLMTAIIRLPAAAEPPPTTEVALLVPVHRPPPADPEARSGATGLDASLGQELEPLLAELAARPDLPATFSVTPDTIARLAADPEHAAVVAALREAVAGPRRQLLDAPYVQLDPASLVDAGLDAEIGRQADLGRLTLTQLLEPPSSATWQLATSVDPPTLEVLAANEIDGLVLPQSALGGAGTTQVVTVGASTGTPPPRALAATTTYALDRGADDDALLAGHRLLARLAAVATVDRPAQVVMQVDASDVAPTTLGVVLDALQADLATFTPRTLDQLLDEAPQPLRTVQPTAPQAVDLGDYPEVLARSRSRLASYEAMVGGRRELVARYEQPLATSAARELALGERIADATSVIDALEEPFTSITVPAGDQVTLGARDARFPLPITSDLDEPVQVVIELESNDRLEFPRNRLETTLQPGRQVVDIEVRTRAPGATPVRITVRTPDDAIVLAESRYTVRSTAVSGVGIVLTVGAVVVLAAWWGRHWRRNRHAHRHARRLRPRRESV